MVDTTELQFVRTFVGSVMTGYTIKTYSEAKKLKSIDDTQRGIVHPGEILIMDAVYYVSRYELELSDATEAALTTGIKNLIAGIALYNRRQTGPTQIASMTHLRPISGSKSEEGGINKRWKIILNLDVTWSVG